MAKRARVSTTSEGFTLEPAEDGFVGRFTAMGGPCEVLVDTSERESAREIVARAAEEALRIERAFSRYRTDNVVHRINHAGGRPVAVDPEAAQLLDYAAQLHVISDGKFDVTSGVLRRAWTFDGREAAPDLAAIASARALVGWHRVRWENPSLLLPPGMEIDFGGIGKEYAVDRAVAIAGVGDPAFLVNFGGDLRATGPRRGDHPWRVGLDDPGRSGQAAVLRLDLERGALATSGDARRFVTWKGRRLGHILDPTTGWPVAEAPRSVTVLAPTCIEAGTLSTLAYLQGANATRFLEEQGVAHWVLEHPTVSDSRRSSAASPPEEG